MLDDLLPIYDVDDAVAVTVEADVDTAWRALLATDLMEVGRQRPLIAALGALRILPEIVAHALHGERPPHPPDHLTLEETTSQPAVEGGWTLLYKDEYEMGLGLVGKFWRPVIEYAQVAPEDFAAFAEPGFAKTIYALSAQRITAGPTVLRGEMRTATTDEHARRWFRRYWTLGVGSGAHLLVQGLLETARDAATAG
jgi:hypothetical protein